MIQGIIGKKLGMTQIFRDNGKAEAVTAIEAGPCSVIQVKTVAKEGYNAVQLGFGEVKQINSPQRGHLKGLGQLKYLREFRVDDSEHIEVGEKIDVSLFKVGDLVDITGVSKGKGFAGVVKRHHFAGGPPGALPLPAGPTPPYAEVQLVDENVRPADVKAAADRVETTCLRQVGLGQPSGRRRHWHDLTTASARGG